MALITRNTSQNYNPWTSNPFLPKRRLNTNLLGLTTISTTIVIHPATAEASYSVSNIDNVRLINVCIIIIIIIIIDREDNVKAPRRLCWRKGGPIAGREKSSTTRSSLHYERARVNRLRITGPQKSACSLARGERKYYDAVSTALCARELQPRTLTTTLHANITSKMKCKQRGN